MGYIWLSVAGTVELWAAAVTPAPSTTIKIPKCFLRVAPMASLLMTPVSAKRWPRGSCRPGRVEHVRRQFFPDSTRNGVEDGLAPALAGACRSWWELLRVV